MAFCMTAYLMTLICSVPPFVPRSEIVNSVAVNSTGYYEERAFKPPRIESGYCLSILRNDTIIKCEGYGPCFVIGPVSDLVSARHQIRYLPGDGSPASFGEARSNSPDKFQS